MRARLIAAVVALLGAAMLVSSSAAAGPAPADLQALGLVLHQIPLDYQAADRTHDSGAALKVRKLTRVASAEAQTTGSPEAASALQRLEHLLESTEVRLQPWPFVYQVTDLTRSAARALGVTTIPRPPVDEQYRQIDAALDQAQDDLRQGATAAAEFQLAAAAARYRAGPGKRLQGLDPTLAARTLAQLSAPAAVVVSRLSTLKADIRLTAQTLGEVSVSKETIVGDAAVIVFREGLEAVLILAALTASFAGARRRLRRPVLLGGLAGLAATAVTWVVAQTIIHSLSSGGLELQAITGLLAIGVLLLVTNWFFHRIYWSEWIGRFNRRRKTLERFDRTGFLSGQMVGLVVLGLTSVYREGFETVLFLQSLQVSAGTGTTMLGVAIGLAATVVVGVITFMLQRKLPYRKMLIVTGLLIAFVLAVMTGVTAHTMQGIGWLPITDTPFRTPFWMSTWLGLYPTWETIFAQVGSLVFVIGSYVLARQLQTFRHRQALGLARS
jgi:high-affinity iron transporter